MHIGSAFYSLLACVRAVGLKQVSARHKVRNSDRGTGHHPSALSLPPCPNLLPARIAPHRASHCITSAAPAMTILAHPSTLASVLKFLPPATYAFAYGSGVLAQPGLYSPQEGQAAAQAQPSNQKKGPMLDFIMAVDDPSAWHKQVSWPRSAMRDAQTQCP